MCVLWEGALEKKKLRIAVAKIEIVFLDNK